MPQKILAGRCADARLRGDLVEVKVDQVVLSRSPNAAFGEAVELGLKRSPVELAIAYDTVCVTGARAADGRPATSGVAPQMTQAGILVARPGVGFPGPVHLERFASPARLAVTDDPRLALVGGAGMLSIVVSPGQLGQALATGMVTLRPPRSVQVLLSGRLRPFVCARDVSLELLRRGLAGVVERVEVQFSAPVVLEFAGPSARLLSVSERAVLCAIAPTVGASGALFVSDEKTEGFLRDQRRSKAHRTLSPDPGAPCDEVVSLDLATVDPLICDQQGTVRPVRDLAGQPVEQVVLGGDSGCTLHDMLAAAALLKSKRVPPRLDFILAPPSRQALEVLGQSGALVDLIATGARIIEPDCRVITGELYPPPEEAFSLRTSDPDPVSPAQRRFLVCSAETLASAVATGVVGDPRSFKRPVRVTVPRALPTDDVLVVRERRGDGAVKRPLPRPTSGASYWGAAPGSLELLEGLPARGAEPRVDHAVVLSTLEEVRLLAERLGRDLQPRAVIAPFIPSGLVPLFAGAGILALRADGAALGSLKGQKNIRFAPVGSDGAQVGATAGDQTVWLSWLAVGAERGWTLTGTSRPSLAPARSRGT